MPSLIVSSRYTTDSQLLRQAAQESGWETLQLDGRGPTPLCVTLVRFR